MLFFCAMLKIELNGFMYNNKNATSETHLQLFFDFAIAYRYEILIAKEQHMYVFDLANGKHGDGKNKKAR